MRAVAAARISAAAAVRTSAVAAVRTRAVAAVRTRAVAAARTHACCWLYAVLIVSADCCAPEYCTQNTLAINLTLRL